MAEAINREQNPKKLFEKAANTIPEPYRDSAIALWADSEDAVANGVDPTEELLAFVRILDDAACEDKDQPDMADREIKSAKYALHETHTKMVDFVSTYGAKQWGVSMYDSQTALIANYINPIIGDMEVQAITPRVVDKYIQTLQKTPPVCKRNRKPKTEFEWRDPLGLRGCGFFQVVNGKILFQRGYWDKLSFLKQHNLPIE